MWGNGKYVRPDWLVGKKGSICTHPVDQKRKKTSILQQTSSKRSGGAMVACGPPNKSSRLRLWVRVPSRSIVIFLQVPLLG